MASSSSEMEAGRQKSLRTFTQENFLQMRGAKPDRRGYALPSHSSHVVVSSPLTDSVRMHDRAQEHLALRSDSQVNAEYSAQTRPRKTSTALRSPQRYSGTAKTPAGHSTIMMQAWPLFVLSGGDGIILSHQTRLATMRSKMDAQINSGRRAYAQSIDCSINRLTVAPGFVASLFIRCIDSASGALNIDRPSCVGTLT
jgi:hypothetical protein